MSESRLKVTAIVTHVDYNEQLRKLEDHQEKVQQTLAFVRELVAFKKEAGHLEGFPAEDVARSIGSAFLNVGVALAMYADMTDELDAIIDAET